jgi:hypothetical protein
MKRLILISVLTFPLFSCDNKSPDREYDECIQKAAQLPTATGVNIASQNCAHRYLEKDQAEKSAASVRSAGNVAHAYWDGWNFQSGEIPNSLKGKGYRIYSVARYGVLVCEVALPEAMGKALFNEDGSFKQAETLNSDLVKICGPK